jgi:Phosphatidylinositol N-acetylglucosaminyltransferase
MNVVALGSYNAKEQRCLWIPRVKTNSSTANELSADSSSYASIYQHFAFKPKTTKRSFFRYLANAIVILQEIDLSCYFFGWHRFLLLQQNDSTNQITFDPHHRFLLDVSTTTMYVALLLAVIFNARSVIAIRNKNQSSQSSTTDIYKSKVLFRIVDAVVLALLLRYVAALLHDLTVSYSTDTVELLAAFSMIVHLLFCDYSYANGYQQHKSASGREAVCNLKELRGGDQKQYQSMENHRPSFKGGTMSLNAVFFATVLLISRFEESDTVASSFIFVSLSVIFFAFYPVSRHTISITFPAHRSGEYFRCCVLKWFVQ